MKRATLVSVALFDASEMARVIRCVVPARMKRVINSLPLLSSDRINEFSR